MPSTVVVRGKAGRLLWGSRVVSEFGRWSAKPVGASSFEVEVDRHTPDPVWWAYANDGLAAELDIGPRPICGPVSGLCREPLRFTLRDEEGDRW